MAMLSTQTSSLIEKDRAFVWHPFTQAKTATPPIPIIRAKGIYLYSHNGNRYVDGISSWWVNLHGHSHPYIIAKMKAQLDLLDHVIFADFTHTPAVELASRLISILPGNMSKIFYSDNGSTAVEVALKIAFQYWYRKNPKIPKTKVICFKHSYHGDTFGAMSAAGKNEFNRPFWNHLFEVEVINPPIDGKESDSLLQVQNILKAGNVACVIYEPLVLAAGGMIIYRSEGLDAIIQCCREQGVLVIADEVMTGFGRTGTLFACDQLKEKPDLICLSKGLTGGVLPLGATACTEAIYATFLSDHLHEAFLHGHSYTGNPLACCSGLASLDLLLEEECLLQRQMIEKNHRNFCREWQCHPKLIRCESMGTLLALEYKTEQHSYFYRIRDHLYRFFISRGVLLRPLGNVLYILPPYCIREEELKFIYEQIILTLEGDL